MKEEEDGLSSLFDYDISFRAAQILQDDLSHEDGLFADDNDDSRSRGKKLQQFSIDDRPQLHYVWLLNGMNSVKIVCLDEIKE